MVGKKTHGQWLEEASITPFAGYAREIATDSLTIFPIDSVFTDLRYATRQVMSIDIEPVFDGAERLFMNPRNTPAVARSPWPIETLTTW